MHEARGLYILPIRLCFFFHLFQPIIVIWKLFQVNPRDFAYLYLINASPTGFASSALYFVLTLTMDNPPDIE
jgi:hypothetical protein